MKFLVADPNIELAHPLGERIAWKCVGYRENLNSPHSMHNYDASDE